jgi:hypothetical protein
VRTKEALKMYKNIRKELVVAPLQTELNGKVDLRKRGRPARDHMKKYTIKLDKLLHEKVANQANKLGTSNSFIIAEGLRMYFRSFNN